MAIIVTTGRIIEATATLPGRTMVAVMVDPITAKDMGMVGRAYRSASAEADTVGNKKSPHRCGLSQRRRLLLLTALVLRSLGALHDDLANIRVCNALQSGGVALARYSCSALAT